MPAAAPLAIGLVAHDDKKAALVDWSVAHQAFLSRHRLYATGTTGGRILQALPDLDLTRLKSGPLGGDQQLGALLAEGLLDMASQFQVELMGPDGKSRAGSFIDVPVRIRIR